VFVIITTSKNNLNLHRLICIIMYTYGAKGHIQQSWIKDHDSTLSELDDIYNYILQINFQLVRTDDIHLLKQNWQFLLKFLFNNYYFLFCINNFISVEALSK